MKILLIEDDKKISYALTKGLKEENYTVDTAFDGDEGLYLATSFQYDLILLDVMIPKIDGFELCQNLREKENFTPIIFLTAKNTLNEKIEGLNLGANDYITKPFSFDELLARMRVQLRGKSQNSNILKIDNLELDMNKKELKRDNQLINLTAKEYALIEYLFVNQGTIITTETLNENFLDLETHTQSNIISVYMYRLRNKIDKKFDKKLLHTIRGIGYKLGEV
ncbi:MAG TPA: response regulator transcription factor [Arcobacter sp.]|nr:response regulator transcription factor [Arcobacter sp.]